MGYVRKRTVYKRVPFSQCWSETGKGPVSTGWVDTRKGTDNEPTIRSRWVAEEIKTDQRPDLFAPTPPLEGVKLVVSNCASRRGAQGRAKQTVLAVLDVRRAYFYAPPAEECS